LKSLKEINSKNVIKQMVTLQQNQKLLLKEIKKMAKNFKKKTKLYLGGDIKNEITNN
jgi:hypothetical protein